VLGGVNNEIKIMGRFSEMFAVNSAYHERVENYSEQIGKTDDINQLKRILGVLMRDARNTHLAVQRAQDELKETHKRVEISESKIRELEGALDKATGLIHEDYLTGILNRRGMKYAFEREVARAERSNEPLCVALLDIDHFKRLNDAYGHDAGDDALIHFVRVTRESLRPADVIARFGGEEFVIILPETPVAEGARAMTRLQGALAKDIFQYKNEKLLITFSAGIVSRLPNEPVDVLINRADQLLYKAKAAGRNRVFVAE
jgi:diguanylate cyclase